jgi:hypothetical protein
VSEYLLYSCNVEFIVLANPRNPTSNYYSEFPDLIFKSTQLEYNFVLKNKDLFEQIFDKYYFLIIFKNNVTITASDFWYLGEPFYRKYPFSMNLDAKTIGFYLNEGANGKKSNSTKDNNNKIKSTDDDGENKNDINDTNDTNDNKGMNKILKYILEIIVVIIIALLAYYIGVTVSEKRKKRANELKDENYEYMPEENKIINEA